MYRVVYKYRGAREELVKEFTDYVRARKFFWYASFKMPGVSRVELIVPEGE